MKFFTGDNLMLGLLGIYAVICLTFLLEKNWPKALYWLSAFGITSSVVWMK